MIIMAYILYRPGKHLQVQQMIYFIYLIYPLFILFTHFSTALECYIIDLYGITLMHLLYKFNNAKYTIIMLTVSNLADI